MLAQPWSPPRSTNSTCTLQLIDPFHCLLSNFDHYPLPAAIVETHQLLPCIKRKGYSAKLKMLNSLKRCFEQLGITMIELPNIAFKIIKPINVCLNAERNKKTSFEKSSPDKILKKQPIITKKISNYSNQLMRVGRWILAPHQKRAVQFFLTHGKRMILSHGHNKGKIVTSLACIEYVRTNKNSKVLIIVPKSELVSWAWHIEQLSISLYVKNNGKYNKISFEVLDWQSKELPESNESVKALKQQTANQRVAEMKAQSKQQIELKRQSTAYYSKNYSHTLVSYQLLIRSSKLQLEQYSFLILSNPEVVNPLEQEITMNQDRLPLDIARQLASIESVLISKQATLQMTRSLLPILNPRLDWTEIYERYGNKNDHLRHQMEYRAAIKSYVCSENDQLIHSPSNCIKSILIARQPDCISKPKRIENQFGLCGQQQPDKSSIKLEYAVDLIKNKLASRYRLCFLATEINRLKLIAEEKLRFNSSQTIILSLSTQARRMIANQINKNQKIIYIGSLGEISDFWQFYHKSHSKLPILSTNIKHEAMTVICGTYCRQHSDAVSRNICTIYRYSNMSYVQLCEIQRQQCNSTQVSIHRVEQISEEIIIPAIDYHILSTCMNDQVEEISSQQPVEQTRKVVNPERYQDSDPNDSSPEQPIEKYQNSKQMIDEKEENIFNNKRDIDRFDRQNNRQGEINDLKPMLTNPICIESQDEVLVINSCSQSWQMKEKNQIFLQNQHPMQPQTSNPLLLQKFSEVIRQDSQNITQQIQQKNNKLIKSNKYIIDQKYNRNLRSKKNQKGLKNVHIAQQVQSSLKKRRNNNQSLANSNKIRSMAPISKIQIDQQVDKPEINKARQKSKTELEKDMGKNSMRVTRSKQNKDAKAMAATPINIQKLRIQSNQIYNTFQTTKDQKIHKQAPIQIDSDSSNCRPIQPVVASKIRKATSKQVLSVKLIPNISQLVDNNSDTLC